MKNNLKYSIFVAVLSLLALVPNVNKVLAAPTVTGADTTANTNEQKASITLTMAAAVASTTAGLGNLPGKLTIGNCVVSFATTTGAGGTAYIGASTYTADDANCSDNLAVILLATSSVNSALSKTLLAQELRGLKNVIDTDHGALAVSGDGDSVIFTSTTTETLATNINLATTTLPNGAIIASTPVPAIVPVAQVTTFTFDSPSLDRTYTYSITINAITYSYVGNGVSTTTAATQLTSAMAGDAYVTCTSSYGVITCTAKTAGVLFTYSTSATIVAITAPGNSGVGHSGGGGGGGTFVPAPGCSAGNLFNASTGAQCINNAGPQGCSGGNLFNASTGQSCVNNAGNPKAAPTSAAFMRSLSLGLQGDDVRNLQTRLLGEGFFSGEVTGYFGPITQKAVKAYQAKYGIDQLGIVGPATRAQLNKVFMANEGSNAAATSQLTPAQISSIMTQINTLLQQVQALQAKLKTQSQ